MTKDTEDAYGGPFAVFDTAGPDQTGITKAAAARALAEPGFEYDKAAIWWKNTAARGLIHPYRRQVSAPRPHWLYRADQVLVAAVLHRMSEAGFAGDAVYQKAALALNVFNALDLMTQEDLDAGKAFPKPPARNPAAWVLSAFLAGQRGFNFELVTFRHETRGSENQAGRVIHEPTGMGTDWHMGREWVRRSIWALELDPIMSHICRDKPLAN